MQSAGINHKETKYPMEQGSYLLGEWEAPKYLFSSFFLRDNKRRTYIELKCYKKWERFKNKEDESKGGLT